MFDSIEEFIKYIPDFDSMSSGDLIPYFVYYHINGQDAVTPKMVRECYEQLSLVPYSNISAYMGNKASGKNAVFLKKKTGYTLTRYAKEKISKSLLVEIEVIPTNNLVDLTLLDRTPFYIKKIAQQMCCCYDSMLYDACLVMMRKLFETLIIECFERFGSSNEIKDIHGNFLYLSDLIPLYLSSSHWSVSRNFEKYIKNIKKYGDLSAHNRRFFAKKKELDEFRFDLRQCLQEIILTIDYDNWNRESHTV